jgi:hypothetical protein
MKGQYLFKVADFFGLTHRKIELRAGRNSPHSHLEDLSLNQVEGRLGTSTHPLWVMRLEKQREEKNCLHQDIYEELTRDHLLSGKKTWQ